MTENTEYQSHDESEWLRTHTPLFECPDAELQSTYSFRWSVFRKHLKRTPVGYVVTEFLPEVPWAGAYNTISCPAGHHFYEGRWLRDPVYLNDYSHFWFRRGGEPRRYSFWAADAIYAHCLVHGNFSIATDLLTDLIANYKAWETDRQDSSGLFWQFDDRDGMEFSIGGSGYRPTINSYMYADAMAISKIAGLAGDEQTERLFEDKANSLRRLIEEKLWDTNSKFFKVRTNEQGLAYTMNLSQVWIDQFSSETLKPDRLSDVCELQGYIPWCFSLPSEGYEEAWSRLMDPSQFYAPFGPTTAEQAHPLFMADHSHECLWNGPSWPFATSQTLTAMARLLREYEQTYVTKDDYVQLLRIYAKSHRRVTGNGETIPWIDENLDPFTGQWIARTKLHERSDANKDRGEDYNHSTYCDLIISGLIGIVPSLDNILDVRPLVPGEWDYFCLENVAYRGRTISIYYDRFGTQYGGDKGFRVIIDGIECLRLPNVGPFTLKL